MGDERYSEKELLTYQAMLKLLEQGADLGRIRVQEIADAAGVGKGTLYEYFGSKEDILQRTMSYCLQSGLEKMERIIEESGSFEELVDCCLGTVTALVRSNEASLWFSLHIFQKNSSVWQECEVMRGKLMDMGKRMMDRAWQLAVQDRDVGEGTEKPYFSYAVMTALIGYALRLFQFAEQHQLTEEICDGLYRQTRKMICRAVG